MSTQKRRVVYFSDEAWAMAKRHAERHKLSVSDWLRALVVANAFDEQQLAKASEAPTVAEANRILEETVRVNHPQFAQRNPYAEFHPVPKATSKHR